jgi:TPR repeat protein
VKAQNFRLLAVLLAILRIAGGLAASAAQQTPSAAEIAELRVKADQGDARAQVKLGFYYYSGLGVPKDSAKAVKLFFQAAEKGNAIAQSNLGVAFESGDGVAKDDAEAVKWYRKAADQGDAESQRSLGAKYSDGEGVPMDKAESVKWYRKAADQGNAEGQYSLGVMYATGAGVPKDDTAAATWYRHAAEQGHPAGQYMLGVRYARGEGVPTHRAEAYKWWLLAGAQGVEDARKQYEILERTLLPTERAEGQRMAREFVPRKGPPLPAGSQVATTSTTQAGDTSQPRPSTGGFFWDWEVVAGLCFLSLPFLFVLHLWQRRNGKTATIATTPASGTSSGQTPMPSVYVLMAGNPRGPFTADQALDMVRQGQLLGETPAWKEGLADWTRLDQVINLTLAVPAASPSTPQLTPNRGKGKTIGPVHITVAIGVFVLAFMFGMTGSLASKGLGWCAFAFTLVMCLHFGAAIFDSNKPQVNREVYFKTAFAFAVQVGWALAVPTFNKLHLLWMYWPTVHLVATLVTKWAIGGFNRSIGLPAPLPLPPLTTTLVLQFALLWLLS